LDERGEAFIEGLGVLDLVAAGDAAAVALLDLVAAVTTAVRTSGGDEEEERGEGEEGGDTSEHFWLVGEERRERAWRWLKRLKN
jgi:hypothetical protein